MLGQNLTKTSANCTMRELHRKWKQFAHKEYSSVPSKNVVCDTQCKIYISGYKGEKVRMYWSLPKTTTKVEENK